MNNLLSVLEKKRGVGICPRFTERKTEVAQYFVRHYTICDTYTISYSCEKKYRYFLTIFPCNIDDITGRRIWDQTPWSDPLHMETNPDYSQNQRLTFSACRYVAINLFEALWIIVQFSLETVQGILHNIIKKISKAS